MSNSEKLDLLKLARRFIDEDLGGLDPETAFKIGVTMSECIDEPNQDTVLAIINYKIEQERNEKQIEENIIKL